MQVVDLLVRQNAAFLRQGRDLIASLDDERYRAPSPPQLTGGGIGAHFRHCLDFYSCFLAGLESGRIDYDARCRDTSVASERDLAIQRIDEILHQLEHNVAQRSGGEVLEVSLDNPGGQETDTLWSRSSLLRELQSLVSHTVHHYALISMLLKATGHQPESGFGVAPSTLDHEKRQPASAG
ncbi:MAG: DinB family protein [Acidobacteriota bacterium]